MNFYSLTFYFNKNPLVSVKITGFSECSLNTRHVLFLDIYFSVG